MKKLSLLALSLLTISAHAENKAAAHAENMAGSREIFLQPSNAPLAMDGGLKTGELALTFDDGPDPVITRKVLAILKKHRIKAVFFEVGNRTEGLADITKEILQQGHSLGSHSWDHADLATLPHKEAVANILLGHSTVEAAGGKKFRTHFFRFPGFSSTPELLEALKPLGLIAFPANIVTEDWAITNPKELLDHSLAIVDSEKHGIILFHDVQPQTAEMLDEFLAEIKKRGYKTVVFRDNR